MKNKGHFSRFAWALLLSICFAYTGNCQRTTSDKGFYPVIGLNTGITTAGPAWGIMYGADFSAMPEGFFLYTMFNVTKPIPQFLVKNHPGYQALNMRTTGIQMGTSIYTKNFIYAAGTGFRFLDASSFSPFDATNDYNWTSFSGVALPVTAQILWTGDRSGIRFSYTVMRKNGIFIHEGLISFIACVGS